MNALGATLSQQLRNPTSYCQTHFVPDDVASMKDRLHSLFVDIYRIGAQILEAGTPDQARWIMYALMFATDRYPVLRDSRRRDVLLKMATVWKTLGHHWEYEHVLEITTGLYSTPSPILEEDPCHLLAASLPNTSKTIQGVLEDLWRETSVIDNVPKDLIFAPIHRAAQLQNGGVLSTILAHDYVLNPAVFVEDEHRRKVAEYLKINVKYVQARVGVDVQDRYRRTPLFLAAAQGSYESCFSLITALAEPNTRDENGHTALEVACTGGHFEIVQLLVGVGAEINPQLMWCAACNGCASSPLQAAIESKSFNSKLVHFLIDCGAYFAVGRLADGKTPIDAAIDGGHEELAYAMKSQHPETFMLGLNKPFENRDQGASIFGSELSYHGKRKDAAIEFLLTHGTGVKFDFPT